MSTDEAQTVYDDDIAGAPDPIPEPPPPPAAPPAAGAHLPEKVPMTAALLSVAPGLGNIYNGLYGRGVAFFLIQFGLIRTAVATQRDEDLAIFIPAIFFFWLFNIFDAYRQAVLINFGGQRMPRRTHRAEAGGFLLPGAILIAIGVIGAADRYLDFDIWSVFDHWPVLMLLAGVALVGRALSVRAGRNAEERG